MDPLKTNILVLDDEHEIRAEINEFLSSRDISVFEAENAEDAFKVFALYRIDIAIVDIRLPGMNGLDFLKEVGRHYPNTHVIIMSGHGDMASVITALRHGAVDYFQKPFHLQDLFKAIEKARKFLSHQQYMDEELLNQLLKETFKKSSSMHMIVVSKAMKVVTEKMRLVARSRDTTVLITGESGTGKELIARGIHILSSRKDKPFHAVNCSTIPDELFESEFFGYRKGAFTGANTDKAGWFEAADGGTLFLDEIGDLKTGLQAKLLRIMEDRQVSRLGSTSTSTVDVRVVAATNQDLEKLMMDNRFRQDLYHRMNAFVIHVPPLRDRKESIPMLLAYYLDFYSRKMERNVPKIDRDILGALQQYDFPGNVRELKHMVERALILCEGDRLTLDHFDHLKIKMKTYIAAGEAKHTGRTLEEIEKETIEETLRESGYNKSEAARMLNISRQALDRKIEKLGISLP